MAKIFLRVKANAPTVHIPYGERATTKAYKPGEVFEVTEAEKVRLLDILEDALELASEPVKADPKEATAAADKLKKWHTKLAGMKKEQLAKLATEAKMPGMPNCTPQAMMDFLKQTPPAEA